MTNIYKKKPPEISLLKTVSIGNGPTGIMILLSAIRNKALENLFKDGYGIIGERNNLGKGNLGYNCKANSAGEDFQSTIPKEILNEISHTESYQKLQNYNNSLAPLALAAQFEKEIGNVLYEILSKSNSSEYLDTTASEIIIDTNNPQNGATILGPDGNPITQNTHNIITALGGSQHLSKDLEGYKEKVVFSDEFFRLSIKERKDEFKQGEKIVIKGGAHSAFSVAHSLLKEHPLGNTFSITILNRGPVSVYYESLNHAKNEGHISTKNDIIDNENNAINRYIGIRGDAKSTYQDIQLGKYPNIEIKTNTLDESEYLQKSDSIIQCFGYEANTLPILDLQGNSLIANDNWDVDSNYLLKGGDPKIFKNINIFNKALGSALDKISVNYNQQFVGNNILSQILGKEYTR